MSGSVIMRGLGRTLLVVRQTRWGGVHPIVGSSQLSVPSHPVEMLASWNIDSSRGRTRTRFSGGGYRGVGYALAAGVFVGALQCGVVNSETEGPRDFGDDDRIAEHPYFPSLLEMGVEESGRHKLQRLFAIGRRIVLMLFTAYEVGLYVDDYGAKSLSKEATLESRLKVLLEDDFTKTIRIVSFRDVPSQHLAGGWTKSLRPRFMKEGMEEGISIAELEETYDRFLRFLPKMIIQGEPLHMSWGPHGSLSLFQGNQQVDTIVSPLLCRVLFLVYLGDESVTPELRDSFQQ
mmetsp:Transcript_23540/g.66030  ORF Transcript_23540/g.66030 Transcript_23540/m.66030 type:complete len:290 (-) Transcript_23540:79-948(-)